MDPPVTAKRELTVATLLRTSPMPSQVTSSLSSGKSSRAHHADSRRSPEVELKTVSRRYRGTQRRSCWLYSMEWSTAKAKWYSLLKEEEYQTRRSVRRQLCKCQSSRFLRSSMAHTHRRCLWCCRRSGHHDSCVPDRRPLSPICSRSAEVAPDSIAVIR